MYNNAIRTLRTLLPDSGSISADDIKNAVENILAIPTYKELNRDKLIREIEELYRIRQDDFQVIEEEERRLPWLNERRSQINFEGGFWGRYRDYLNYDKNFPPNTVNQLDRLTDKILDSLYDPTNNYFIDKKGLVVGQVQSGKTSNYTGLICKAADAGFRFIIVLAGIHNNLRSQTQLRLDEGFLGFDTKYERAFKQNNLPIGVGKGNHLLVARSAANSLGLNFNTKEPIIAVIKKNPHVLKRIHAWLSAQANEDEDNGRIIKNKSLLLIDDEADNASINISNDPDERSTINRWITNILGLFGKRGYVGYTATPFANIFIPPESDNLFPRDFIINIPTPSNYIGPGKIFGFEFHENNLEVNDTLPIVNRIDDHEAFVPNKHKNYGQLPSELPDSLKLAVRCFIITCAIRRLRGQITAHNSMLVHVSRFQRWQDHITEMIENQFQYYRRGIDQNDFAIIDEFRRTFEEDEDGYKSYVTVSDQILNSKLGNIDTKIQKHKWEDVLLHLNDAVSRIEVKAIHGGSGEALDYYEHKNGFSVIAIGGNKLSRGLTLEGLSVSYYLRSSRMYDTLMQMGRWFGYRSGYPDLCRLFTSRELNEWFCHITHASQELREEFDYMADVAGSSPEEYVLKVHNHPGVLQISATNKLRSATTVHVSWSGRLVESYELKKDIDAIENNIRNTQRFLSNLPSNFFEKRNSYLWYDIPAENVVSFLNGFQSIENLKAYNPHNLVRFIDRQLRNNELTHWRVALMSKSNAANFTSLQIAGVSRDIGLWVRKQDGDNSNNEIYYIRKSHIISPRDEAIDFTEQEYNTAMNLTYEKKKLKNGQKPPNYPNGEIIRNEMRDPKNPLLLIYLLDPFESETGIADVTNPFVGYAISFPKSNYNSFESYAVNEELLPYFNIEDDFDESEEYED
jgi:hypothetical protein